MKASEQTEEQAGFEVIKAARQWLNEDAKKRETEQIRTPSATTVKEYTKEVRRLVTTGNPWKAAADTTKNPRFSSVGRPFCFFAGIN